MGNGSGTARIGAWAADITDTATNARAPLGDQDWGYVDVSLLHGAEAAVSVRLSDPQARRLMERLRESIQFLDECAAKAQGRVIHDQSRGGP